MDEVKKPTPINAEKTKKSKSKTKATKKVSSKKEKTDGVIEKVPKAALQNVEGVITECSSLEVDPESV